MHVSRIYTGTLTNSVTRAATHTYAHTGGAIRDLTAQLADLQAHLFALHARLRGSWVALATLDALLSLETLPKCYTNYEKLYYLR